METLADFFRGIWAIIRAVALLVRLIYRAAAGTVRAGIRAGRAVARWRRRRRPPAAPATTRDEPRRIATPGDVERSWAEFNAGPRALR